MKIVKKIFATLVAFSCAVAFPISLAIADGISVLGEDRVSVPCDAYHHSNQAKIVCRSHSPRWVRATISCRLWFPQSTPWIKDGTAYSGGCIFGVNDTKSGNPVTMEIGDR